MTLNWTSTVPDAPAFQHWAYTQWVGGGSPVETAISGGKSVRTHTVTGLTNGTAYNFAVRRAGTFVGILVGVAPNSNTVTVTPNPPTAGVTLSKTSLTVDEGSSETYTVKLDKAPSANVTITVGGASGEVTVAGSPLTFTPGNFSTAQTITVRAAADEDTTNDTATLTHTASSTDTAYGASLAIDDVAVTVTDTTPTLQLSTDPAAVTEGTAISLTVTSDKARTGDLTVNLTLAARSSSGFTAADISGALGPRNFTASFGNSASTTGTVTIPTSADTAVEGAEAYRITLNDGAGYAVGADATADGTLNDGTTASVPAAPTSLTATAGNGQVKLTWTKPAGSITGYKLRYGKTPSKASATWGAMTGSGAATISHTVTGLDNGSEYSFKLRAVNASGDGAATDWVTATPEAPGVTVSTAALTVAEGSSGSYTVKLDARPSGTVTVTVGGASGDVTVTGSPLTFTTANYGTAQMVTVTAAEDTDTAADPDVTLTHSASGGGYGSVSIASVVVSVTENDTPPAPTGLSAAGGNGQVVLTWSNPNNASITGYKLRHGKTTERGSATWTAISDSGASTISHTVTGLDNGSEYSFKLRAVNAVGDGAETAWMTATPQTPSVAGVTISTAALTVAEGGTGSYTVKLDKEPSGTVTVTVAGMSGDVTVTGSPLTFTTANYGTAQTVTVTAAEDPDAATDPDVTLTHTASGGGYGSVSIASVVVSVTENDTPPAPTGLSAAGGNGQAALTWSNPNNASITGYKLRYGKTTERGSATWSTMTGSGAGTVSHTVTGLENGSEYSFQLRAVNAVGDGAATAWVTATPTAAATTPTPPVTTPTPPAIDGSVTVTPTALTVAEGSSAAYTVALDTEPSADVTVTVGGASGDVTVEPASLTFTPANYGTAQTVTVTAAEDDDATPDTAVTLTHNASGGGYGAVSIDAVTVTITENDEAGVTLSTSTLSVEEGGSGNYTVVLDSQPTDGVTVTIGGASGDVTATPASLTFTPANYHTAQTVTVMAAEDEDAVTDVAVTLTHNASGGGYGSVSIGAVTVTITENDETAVRLSTSSLTVEEGSSGNYTVVLDSRPTDEVTVTIGGASGDVTATPASLTFTPANYATGRTVTVTAAEDEDAVPDAAVTLTHNASGGGYGAVSIGAVTVTITEDDEAGVTLSVSALTLEEGGSGHYTVVLDSQPTDEVTVTIGGASGDVTVTPASLTFTPANYATGRTVTVSVAEDDDAVPDAAVTLTHNASGGDYGSVNIGGVTVTITEDDEAGVTLSASSLTLEEGRSGNYTVVLDSQPVGGEVTVTPGSADSSALTVLPGALRFTAANWNTAQTVTVTSTRDDNTDDETVRVRHAVSGGDYEGVTAPSVTVTVIDTTAAERAGRANRVNARVLPQVAAATLSQTLTAVTERIGAVASGNPGAALQFGALPGRTLEEEWDFLPRSEPSAPSVSEMLDGATFALPLGMSDNQTTSQLSRLAAWGRGERVSLSGTEEEVSWDGDLWSAHLGADRYIRPDLLAGAALSYGQGEVDTQTTDRDGSRIAGTYETTLTAIHPYVSHMLADGSHLWGSMGYGQGEVRIREGNTTRKTDLSQWSVALGGRRVLLEEAERIAGGLTRIALKGEGALAQLDTDAQEDLTELTVKTTRLRLLLEGSHERALEGEATLTPALEAGLRHDGGDLGSGLGLEAGASLTWRDPRAGWLAQLRARSLVAHEKDRDEWGISALVRVEPAADGRGLSLSFGPEYGHTASGMERWFDYRLSPATANSATRDDREGRLEAELGYGIGVSRTGAMALVTPYAGFSLGQSGSETFRVGARYRLGEGLSVGIEGKHQPQAAGENSWMLRAAVRW